MAHLRVLTILQKSKVTLRPNSLNSVLLCSNHHIVINRNNHACYMSSGLIKNNRSSLIEKDESKISKSVFISQSSNVFTNLALEDWLFKNFDFSNHHVLLLWVNSPCVVIGRNQNPWLEANCGYLSEKGVELARRNSGGGTVYHDYGNLNITFFTPEEQYKRRRNLELISTALKREWGLKAEINKKEDIVIDDIYKISGTASRLARPNAYHHCTLLVDVHKENLSKVLLKFDRGIKTNATASIPSPVKNLSEVNSTINVQRLISSIGWEYLRTTALSKQDGGWDFVAKQKGFQMINPTDEWFPGLQKIQSEFESWEWKYGRTPKFEITRSFPLPQYMSTTEQLQITMNVASGLVADVVMKIPPSLMSSNTFVEEMKVITNLKGRRFTEDAFDELNTSFGLSPESLRTDNKQFVADCVRKVMVSV